MIFYNFDFSKEVKTEEQCESGRKKFKRYGAISNLFSESIEREGYFFVVSEDEEMMKICCVFRGGVQDKNKIKGLAIEFCKKLEVNLKFESMAEISIQKFMCGIAISNENEFLRNNDIREMFGLRFDVQFDEIACETITKKKAISEAEKQFCCAALVKEIERIYEKKHKGFGVPVHYIFENCDANNKEANVKLLASCLASNGRCLRKKFALVEVKKTRAFKQDVSESVQKIYELNTNGVVVFDIKIEVEDEDLFTDGVELLTSVVENTKRFAADTTTVFVINSKNKQTERFIKSKLKNMLFVEIFEEPLQFEKAKELLQNIAKKKIQGCKEDLSCLLDKNRYYVREELYDIFKNWYDKYLNTEQFPQYAYLTREQIEPEISVKGDAYKQLGELIGLDGIKETIENYIDYAIIQKEYRKMGEDFGNCSKHMVFTGDPGTAKTTVARIVAQILKENGLLSNGRLIEVGRADLVSRYVGGTAVKVKEIFDRAIGNVLFIDEAYSLLDGDKSLYGDEAINTIVQEMENYREDMVVIFAGYKNKMAEFIDRNPGLKSRIAYQIDFPNYTTDQLLEIAKLDAKRMKLDISACEEKIKSIIESKINEENFGQGRFVRSLLEKARMRQATRLVKNKIFEKSEMCKLLPEDIVVPAAQEKQKTIGFTII